ncbi:energy transducer TonB [Persicitalea sp.]|uniref:energy transducer TonB n=1 Tax=Persicitalea sp. TaxID=3100273 RepID=UPI003594795B
MNAKFLLPLLLLLSISAVVISSHGQGLEEMATQSRQDDTTVYTVVEKAPGDKESMFQFIQSASKYPVSPKKGSMVQIRLLIEKDGSISRVQVSYTDPNTNDDLVREALRIAKTMPNWIPGSQDGRPLRILTIFPIRFVKSGK